MNILEEEIKKYIENIEYLNSAIAEVEWDSMVMMPKKAMPYRSRVIGYLSGEAYKLQTSDEVKKFIDYLSGRKDLNDVEKGILRNLKKNYYITKKIPQDVYKEYVTEISNAQSVWEEAKKNNDFNMFKPHLKKIIEFKKEFIKDWGCEGKNKYDALLDLYEPGITVEKLDEVFSEVKDAIIKLLKEIEKSNVKPDVAPFHKNFPKKDQEDFSMFVLGKMGFDFGAGRVDESMHPFTTNFDNKDVRITTHYYENEFRSALFSCIHEGGHTLYEQDIPDSLKGTGLAQGVSMGVHESQSRFYENIIGRSKEFWTYFYPEVQKRFPQFKGFSLDEFYKGINAVEPSLVRTEADELTYSLHIVIRYEVEKEIFNGNVDVDDLPALWNRKYKEYLGVEPQNDAEGVLQDIHWAGGDFGYFPSYALGNLYGAQFLHKMKKDIPDIMDRVSRGDLNSVHEWLKNNVHKYGSVYKPVDLIKIATGEELNAKYFIDYLNKKYKDIYKL